MYKSFSQFTLLLMLCSTTVAGAITSEGEEDNCTKKQQTSTSTVQANLPTYWPELQQACLGDRELRLQVGKTLIAEEIDYDRGKAWLELAAKAGSAEAAYELGKALIDPPKGFPQNLCKATTWLLFAHERGNKAALSFLACSGASLLEEAANRSVPDGRSLPSARRLIEIAAQKGNADAQRQMGIILMNGEKYGVAENEEKGREWLQKAANNNDSIALITLAFLTLEAGKTTEELSVGFDYLAKAATIEITKKYIDEETSEKVLSYIRLLAQNQHCDAKNLLWTAAIKYLYGQSGYPRNIEKAFSLYEETLGMDKENALSHMLRASECIMGGSLLHGSNTTLGLALFERTARAGSGAACRILGAGLVRGYIVIEETFSEDPKKGLEWLHKAADTHLDAEAQLILGKLYCDGINNHLKKNEAKGMAYIQKAANKNYFKAVLYIEQRQKNTANGQ